MTKKKSTTYVVIADSYYLARLPIHYLHRSLHIRTDQTVSCLLISFRVKSMQKSKICQSL